MQRAVAAVSHSVSEGIGVIQISLQQLQLQQAALPDACSTVPADADLTRALLHAAGILPNLTILPDLAQNAAQPARAPPVCL
jgi:hypothetical protein